MSRRFNANIGINKDPQFAIDTDNDVKCFSLGVGVNPTGVSGEISLNALRGLTTVYNNSCNFYDSLGTSALLVMDSSMNSDYILGYRAGGNNNKQSIYIGYNPASSNTGTTGLFIGFQAGNLKTGGDRTIMIGNDKCGYNASCNDSIFIGGQHSSLGAALIGDYNYLFGTCGHYLGGTSTAVLMLGYLAGAGGLNTSNYSIILGYAAAYTGDNFDYNVVLGSYAAYQYASGSRSVMIGDHSAYNNLLTNSVSIGAYAGYGNLGAGTNYSGCVFIGYGAGYGTLASNKLVIGNTTTNKLINGDFSTGGVTIDGFLAVGIDYSGIVGPSAGDLYATRLKPTNALGVIYGGTGYNTYAVGDLLFASTTTTLGRLAVNANVGYVLSSNGSLPIYQSLSTLLNNTTQSLGSLSLTTALPATSGGTGYNTYAVGDLLFASTTTTLGRLAVNANVGYVLSSNGSLPIYQSLSTLLNNTTQSFNSISLTTALSATNGGTGLSSYTIGDLLCAVTTSSLTKVSVSLTAGYVLASNGAGVVPSYQSVSSLLNGSDQTFNSLSLTTALPATSGGTGNSSFAVGDLLYAGTTTTLSKLSVSSTVGYVLTSNGTGVAPSYQSLSTLLNNTTQSFGALSLTTALPATSGGTGNSSFAVGDLLYAGTTTTLSKLSVSATVGYVLTSNGTGVAPSYQSISAAFSGSNQSFNSLSLTTPLAATSGGTGFSSFTVGDIMVASTTSALAKLNAAVNVGYVIASNGASTQPTYQSLTALLNNTTLSLSSVSLSTPLSVGNGGTGNNNYVIGDILVAGGLTTLNKVSVSSTVNDILASNGTGFTPSYKSIASIINGQSVTIGTLSLTNALTATNGGTGFNGYTTGDILVADTSSTLAKLSASTAGYVLTSNGPGAAPSWQASSGGGGGGTGTLVDTFETVSQNVYGYNYTISYNVDGSISNMVYTTGTGTITKTFTYDGSGNILTIVLSGGVPMGIKTTKTFSYTGGILTSITYS